MYFPLPEPKDCCIAIMEEPVSGSCLFSNTKFQCIKNYNNNYTSEHVTSGKLGTVYPFNPTFKKKLGFARLYLFFFLLVQSIDCGYSLEPR